MPLNIVRQDISKMNTDAIVAAEGHDLSSHGQVGSAIAEAAGPKYQEACIDLGYCDTGEVKVTEGYDLPARLVFHIVGPKYHNGHCGEGLLLQSCYEKVLQTAVDNDCTSIAIPLISTGGYGFPKDEGLKIAIDTITAFLTNHEIDVYLVIYDRKMMMLSRQMELEVQEYIDDNYEGDDNIQYRGTTRRSRAPRRPLNKDIEEYHEISQLVVMESSSCYDNDVPTTLEKAIKIKDESFQQMLLRLIEEKHMKNAEVYTRANMSKSHFSKIKLNEDYKPKRETVFALAIALKLDIDETKELMMKAGYAISHSFMLDTIVEYFILKGNYKISDINMALFDHDQPLLGERPL